MDRFGDILNAVTRPIITGMLVGGLLWGFFERLITGDVYATIVTAVVGYWFGRRELEHEQQRVAAAAAEQVVAQTVERRGGRRQPSP